MGLIRRPFEVRDGGYLVRYKGRRQSTINGPAFPVARRRAKESKPNGRTRRRLEQIAKISGNPVKLPPLGGHKTRAAKA
jgi:hypothetical protein